MNDYIHALDILRQRSEVNENDPTGYAFQASLHNGSAGPCEHQSDLFLPWHRAHLHYFEKLLQAADPPRTQNVTIPYWDWISEQTPAKFPLAFKKPGLKSPRSSQAAALPPDTLSIVTTETNQKEFAGYPNGDLAGNAGRLERGPHDYMHGFYIGGAMGNPSTAAEDAIYFSFHAFIDLMWAEWQQRNGTPLLTSPDHVLRGFTTQPRNKVSDFTNTVDLDYEYEYTDRLKAAFAVPVPPPVPLSLLATEPLTPLGGADLATELRDKEIVHLGLAVPETKGQRLLVRLDELKVPQTGSYMLRGYVHPSDVLFQPDDSEFTDRFAVGYVALWRAHPHLHHDGPAAAHHPVSRTARFDVTHALDSLGANGADLVFSLQFIPAPSPTGLPPHPAPPLDEVELKDVRMEVYS
ncbi:tyrosinase family protein [Streptomyces olivochromogenes]|uniref:tyrosinase family protein n=1 Tax=Streptomyces olivochromogenes TaxID=1963 RepID=UPI001F3E1CD7|nr:tyrosinase family protein [Streptomyces olivochromogenes]MCF3130140.1 tyrosinase family protein [Streptomyces olivochromogenes]